MKAITLHRKGARTPLFFLITCVFVLVFGKPHQAPAQFCQVCATYSPAYTWPPFVPYTDVDGFAVHDVANDQSIGAVDLVYGATPDTASGLIGQDCPTDFFVRFQLRESPVESSGPGGIVWKPYRWQVYLADEAGNARAVVGFDGMSSPQVVYVCDPFGGHYVIVYRCSTQPECARSSVTASGTYYFDFQCPLCYVQSVSCQTFGFANMIGYTTPMKLYYGTSEQLVSIDKDYSYGSALNWTNMHTTRFDWICAGELTPVELSGFTASSTADAIHLKWRTQTEVNNAAFDIERSFDRAAWKTIGRVPGHGTVNTPQVYRWVDPIMPEFAGHPKVYYRLHQFDRDGKSKYLPDISVALGLPLKRELSCLYPNPMGAGTSGDRAANIAFTLPTQQRVTLTVVDALGREVRRLHDNELLDAGSHLALFHPGSLPAGDYYYMLLHGEERDTGHLLLLR
jgi:hypothetical protein